MRPWGVSVLPNYRLYRLDGAGKISNAEWLSADDDSHASDLARAIETQTTLEVWDRDRLVARIKPDGAARPQA
jgi:hypothetical protein